MANKPKPYKPKRRIGKPPHPSDVWNAPERSYKVSVDRATVLLDKLKRAPGAAWDKAFQFFTDIEQRVTEMKARLEDQQHVSEGQEKALINWDAAVSKIIKQHEPGPP